MSGNKNGRGQAEIREPFTRLQSFFELQVEGAADAGVQAQP
jgi:hypothetical protein